MFQSIAQSRIHHRIMTPFASFVLFVGHSEARVHFSAKNSMTSWVATLKIFSRAQMLWRENARDAIQNPESIPE